VERLSPDQEDVAMLTRRQDTDQTRLAATEALVASAQRRVDKEQQATQSSQPTQPGEGTSAPQAAPPGSAQAQLDNANALNAEAQQRLDQTNAALDEATAPTPSPVAT